MQIAWGYVIACLIAILLHTGQCLSQKVSCKNEQNKNVDWYIIYKIPKIKDEPEGTDLKDGVSYAYILAPGSKTWTLSTKNVESGSMLEKTLNIYYSGKKKLTYILYNDDLPGKKTKSSTGHLKGVVVFGGKTGFWLIHSIPNFPHSSKYKYPDSGTTYGQVAICVTFKTPELDEIAQQLLYSNPNIYNYKLSNEVKQKLNGKAQSLFSNKAEFIKKAPFTRETNLTSAGGTKFISFAKDNQLNEDLYSKILAPSLKTSLIVETWRKGSGGIEKKYCKKEHTVVDVNEVNMTFNKGKKEKTVSFKYTVDHSKWSISDETSKNYVCIADLNRMPSQGKRGGGALCFKSTSVVKAFESIIGRTDTC